jgi:hypothetical protein
MERLKSVGKVLAAASSIALLILAAIVVWHCLRRAPNTNVTMPVREVHVRLSGRVRPDPALLEAITTVEIGHASWVRIGADSACVNQQSQPEMILVSAATSPNGADPSKPPSFFDVQIGAESAWELQLDFDNPSQIKLTASARNEKPRAELRPPDGASVAGCGKLPKGTQITAEGDKLELLLHFTARDKNSPALPILGKLSSTAVSGKLARDQKQDADITRTTHCEWDTRDQEFETFGVVAAGTAAADLTVDKLELREAIADLQFTWSHVAWQPGGDCSCRCIKDLHDLFSEAKH